MILKFIRYITLMLAFAFFPRAGAINTSYYASGSRLASGVWVKVKVTDSGIQRISHEQLAEWGFSDPARVRVFGFSGVELARDRFDTSMPDDLPMQYSEHIGDALYFYGEGDCRVTIESPDALSTIRNYYSTYSVYFLSDTDADEDNDPQIVPTEYIPSDNVIATCLAIDYQEREQYNPGPGGAYYFSRPIAENPETNGTYSFHTPDLAENGTLVLNYMPVARTLADFSLNATLPDNLVRLANSHNPRIPPYLESDAGHVICSRMPGRAYYYLSVTDGASDFSVKFEPPANPRIEWVALDYAAMIWQRNNRLGDNAQLDMQFPEIATGYNITISEAAPDTRVWDVSSPMAVCPMETHPDNDEMTVTVSPSHRVKARLVAFNPSSSGGFPTPEFMGNAANTNLHGSNDTPEMIIITNNSLREAADNLADLHRSYQGMSVKVVNAGDIYNEFSSGAPSAIGLRRYVKMMFDRNTSTLKYLALMGHGTYDNRHLLLDDRDYLPTYQATDNPSNPKYYYTYEPRAFSSDVYFGMLDDNFDPDNIPRSQATIGVGRINVPNSARAAEQVSKVRDYFETYAGRDDFTRSAVMAGFGDSNSHTAMAEDVSRTILNTEPAVKNYKLYSSLFTDQNSEDRLSYVRNVFAEGLGFAAFAGHASADAIGPPALLTRGMALDMPFGNHPMMMLATCHGVNIDRSTASVGQSLFDRADGPIAVISACRQVYLSRNKAILDAVTYHYSNATPDDMTGDVWRKGFNKAITDMNDDVSGINTLCYNMVGDPAIPLGKPAYRTAVTRVNGAAPGQSPVKTPPYTTLELEGIVTNPDGSRVEDFNGQVIVTVLDGAYDQAVLNFGGGDTATSFRVEETTLAKASGNVSGAEWKVSLFIPKPSVPDPQSNKVIITAINNNGSMRATSTWRGISVPYGELPENPADTHAPEITAMYLDSPEFSDGDGVNSDCTLYATIGPDMSGIYLSESTLGNSPALHLDGTAPFGDITRRFVMTRDGGASLKIPMSNLSPGEHTLTLGVSDNLGNRAEQSISFVVANNTVSGSLAVDDRIITAKAVFDLSTSSVNKASRLIIQDASGNTVFTRENPTFPLTWTPAASLPDGNYRARVYLTRGSNRGMTPDTDLILLRK